MKSKSPTQKSSSTSESSPWKPAQDQLKDILSQAQDQYDKTGGLDGNWIDKQFPDLTDEMKSSLTNLASSGNLKQVTDNVNQITAGASSNVNNASNTLNGLANGGITSDQINQLAGSLYDNDTVKSQVQQLTDDGNQNLDRQVQGLNQSANSSGNMGSSRAGVAQGVMTGETNKAIARGTADIQNTARTNAYNQAIGTLQNNQATNLNAANSLGSLGMNQGQLQANNAGIYQNMLQNQATAANTTQTQAQGQADNNWFNQVGNSNAGWDNLSKYLQTVGSIGGMGGTSNTSGSSSTSGGGSSMLSTVMGAGSTGAGIIGSGAQAGWWSDASMKKNVKKTGKTKDGTTTYDWDWNESGKEKGMTGKGSGVLAQQLAKEKPEAVQKQPDGKLMVNYDQTEVTPTNSKAKKKKKGKK